MPEPIEPIGECEAALSDATTAASARLVDAYDACASNACRDAAIQQFSTDMAEAAAAYDTCKRGLGVPNP